MNKTVRIVRYHRWLFHPVFIYITDSAESSFIIDVPSITYDKGNTKAFLKLIARHNFPYKKVVTMKFTLPSETLKQAKYVGSLYDCVGM